MRGEPLAVAGAVVALVQAVLGAVVLMGWWPLTAEQAAAWMTVIALAGTAVVVVVTRGRVTPLSDPRDGDGQRLTPEGV